MKSLPLHRVFFFCLSITLKSILVPADDAQRCSTEITSVKMLVVTRSEISEADASNFTDKVYFWDGKDEYLLKMTYEAGGFKLGAFGHKMENPRHQDIYDSYTKTLATDPPNSSIVCIGDEGDKCIYASTVKDGAPKLVAVSVQKSKSTSDKLFEMQPKMAAYTWALDKYQCEGLSYLRLERQVKIIRQNRYNISTPVGGQTSEASCKLSMGPYYTPFFEYPGFPGSIPHYLVPYQYPGSQDNYHLAIWKDGTYAYWRASSYKYQSFHGAKLKLLYWDSTCPTPTPPTDPPTISPVTGVKTTSKKGVVTGPPRTTNGSTNKQRASLSFSSILSILLVSLIYFNQVNKKVC